MIWKNNKYALLPLARTALTALAILFFFAGQIIAQEPPPRPIEVTVSQNLSFGAFTAGISGGTVTVDFSGTRGSTGDVILLNLGYAVFSASYRLVGNPGTVVSILNGTDVPLAGSNGGSMLLHIGTSNPASPFVINTTPPNYTVMSVGATLTVGNAAANPPGSYSGSFFITFIQE
jgi:hypothetical protein